MIEGIKVKRVARGAYELQVGEIRFTALSMDFMYDDDDHHGNGWRLMIEDADEISGFEWCNDFATLWECKDAAIKSAARCPARPIGTM